MLSSWRPAAVGLQCVSIVRACSRAFWLLMAASSCTGRTRVDGVYQMVSPSPQVGELVKEFHSFCAAAAIPPGHGLAVLLLHRLDAWRPKAKPLLCRELSRYLHDLGFEGLSLRRGSCKDSWQTAWTGLTWGEEKNKNKKKELVRPLEGCMVIGNSWLCLGCVMIMPTGGEELCVFPSLFWKTKKSICFLWFSRHLVTIHRVRRLGDGEGREIKSSCYRLEEASWETRPIPRDASPAGH